MISAIVLAAGLARRFGSSKTLALHRGKPLVRHVVDSLALRDIDETIVVVPPGDAHRGVLAQTAARVIVNERPSEGMSASLLLALEAVHPGTQAVLIALADQPTIERRVVSMLISEWRASRAPIVAPLYTTERGHPVLFDVTVFPELRAITGDRGARDVLDADPTRVRLVPVGGEAPRDVDTPDDLAALTRRVPH